MHVDIYACRIKEIKTIFNSKAIHDLFLVHMQNLVRINSFHLNMLSNGSMETGDRKHFLSQNCQYRELQNLLESKNTGCVW
jgi:hypothetical protein